MPSSHPMHGAEATSRFFRTPVQIAARAVAYAFLLFSLMGGSVLDIVVHLAFGLAGIMLARNAKSARAYLVAGGGTYLLLLAADLLIAPDTNVLPVGAVGDWLRPGFGAAMIILGIAMGHVGRRSSGRSGYSSPKA